MEEITEHILDLARNSIEAGADFIEISVREDPDNDILSFSVKDNGCGIEPENISRVTSPFYSGRDKHVGLGIPLLQSAIESCGGDLIINSNLGLGTEIKAVFPYYHVDRSPLGNVSEVITVILSMSGDISLVYSHYYKNKLFSFNTEELKNSLIDVPLNMPAVLTWVEEYLEEEIKNLKEAFK